MNTTTCFHCGQDFHDRGMIPLPTEGELCVDCMAALRDAAPYLLEALQVCVRSINAMPRTKQAEDIQAKAGMFSAVAMARNAIAIAKEIWFKIARADANNYTPEGNEANARLIAAAPDLLASLQMFVAAVDEWQDDDLEARSGSDFIATCETTAECARAAIAKAEGKQ